MAISSVQAILKGTTYNLTLNSDTGLYEGNITAPSESSYNNNSEHYFPVTLKATDSAGNSTTINDTNATLGSKLKLQVKETTAPAIVISSPTESEITSNTMPTINFTVTDADSGVNPDSISVTVDSGSAVTSGITKTAITNGYSCSYAIPTALTDGTHTVKINVKDNDGNSATERTVNFKVDATPPALSVTEPVNNLITNVADIVVAGTTSDVTSGINKVTVKLNGGTETEVTVNADGSFSTTLTLEEGANTIVVTSTDVGGLSSSITRIVTLDTSVPEITDITITPNPVSTGEVIKVTVKVTD